MVQTDKKRSDILSKRSQSFISHKNHMISYAYANELIAKMAAKLAKYRAEQVFIYLQDSHFTVLILLAVARLQLRCVILNRSYSQDEVEFAINRVQLPSQLLITDSKIELALPVPTVQRDTIEAAISGYTSGKESDKWGSRSELASDVIIFTTGTTGTPKAVLYAWETLLKQTKQADSSFDATWLLVYPLNHFAGLQMLAHILANREHLIIPESRDVNDLVESIVQHRINSISATPTFWRLFSGKLSIEQRQQVSVLLKRITLGGEPATGDILQRLRHLFPDATISHVYATSELGSCFSVRDGMPGFPVDYLRRQVGNVHLKVVDGELYVLSPSRMKGYVGEGELNMHGEWVATGDLVEIVDDRGLFRGRKSEVINVGGVKVFPTKVEEVVLSVVGVRAARAFGRPNPITGQVVAMEIELEDGADEQSVLQVVRSRCKHQLTRYEQPRELLVTTVINKRNDKIVRRN